MSSPISERYIDNLRNACREVSKYMRGISATGQSHKSSSSKGQQDHSTCKDGICVVTWKPGKHAV
jgi:hypothetical protein